MTNPIDIIMDPARYGYVECPHCHGYGSSLKEHSAKCTQCGGLGLIKLPPKGDA